MRWIAGYLAMAAAISTAGAEPTKVTPVPAATADPSISFISGALKTAAVSERYNLLIAGGPGKLVVYPLQIDGTPAAAPTQTLELTLPPSLQAVANYPLSITFHPVLPLVYVWQDITSPYSANKPEGYNDLCHLAIYRIAGTQLQLVGTYAKGDTFIFGQNYGNVGVPQNGKRLLLPNVYGAQAFGLGICELTEAGLPVVEAGKTDPDVTTLIFSNNPQNGLGMINGPNGLLVTGYAYGALAVDLDLGQVVNMTLGAGYSYFAGGNDKKPIDYFVTPQIGMVVAMEQVDGYLTQLPRITIYNTPCTSPPVVMTGKKLLAAGGVNLLLLIDLDDNGWPLPKAQTIAIQGTPTQITYSEKYNRLYVPVN